MVAGKHWLVKKIMLAITTGGPEKVYQHDGANRFTINEFLRPFEQTANLCGMKWEEPFVMFGVHYLDEESIKLRCVSYQEKIRNLIQ